TRAHRLDELPRRDGPARADVLLRHPGGAALRPVRARLVGGVARRPGALGAVRRLRAVRVMRGPGPRRRPGQLHVLHGRGGPWVAAPARAAPTRPPVAGAALAMTSAGRASPTPAPAWSQRSMGPSPAPGSGSADMAAWTAASATT